jgi:predicted small lipoprotein YifL
MKSLSLTILIVAMIVTLTACGNSKSKGYAPSAGHHVTLSAKV